MRIASEIFKAYDIRGIVDQSLTCEAVQAIGRILGSLALENQSLAIAVGRDGRLSGQALQQALMEGIVQSGADVLDIGMVPTPVAYFAAFHLQCGSCVAVTGSHNPKDYNGLKMVIAGKTLALEEIQAIRMRIEQDDFRAPSNGQRGQCKKVDVRAAYFQAITQDIHLARRMKIAIDCGNGVAGAWAPELLQQLNVQADNLFCDVDGHFPHHHPDPSKLENLADLIQHLKNSDAELGLAFDGDGDRLGVVTKSGEVIFPDRQLMLFAEDILAHQPGATILFDVKCTRLLNDWIQSKSGKPLMWKTGHALIKQKLKETGAALAGEMSGHLFFNDRWFGFDDALYSAARLLEILSRAKDPNAVLEHLPNAPSTPELNIKMQEGEPFLLIEKLNQVAAEVFQSAQKIITIDGLRVEYAQGFGLIRASNTTPVVVLRFEAENESVLKSIQNDFKTALLKVWEGLSLPF